MYFSLLFCHNLLRVITAGNSFFRTEISHLWLKNTTAALPKNLQKPIPNFAIFVIRTIKSKIVINFLSSFRYRPRRWSQLSMLHRQGIQWRADLPSQPPHPLRPPVRFQGHSEFDHNRRDYYRPLIDAVKRRDLFLTSFSLWVKWNQKLSKCFIITLMDGFKQTNLPLMETEFQKLARLLIIWTQTFNKSLLQPLLRFWNGKKTCLFGPLVSFKSGVITMIMRMPVKVHRFY